jgi:hypothetical protein
VVVDFLGRGTEAEITRAIVKATEERVLYRKGGGRYFYGRLRTDGGRAKKGDVERGDGGMVVAKVAKMCGGE